MPRKANLQALAIVGHPSAGIDENENNGSFPVTSRTNNERNHSAASLNSPLSPLTHTTPKSPRSPFKFTLKPASTFSSNDQHSNSLVSNRRPSMQLLDPLQPQKDDQANRTEVSTSPTSSLHPDSQNQTYLASPVEAASESQEGSKRQARGGFFSNHKASKSSGRLHVNRSQVPDESMPVRENSQQVEMTSSQVAVSSAAEAKRNGGSELKKTVTRKPVRGTAKSSDVSLALSSADSMSSEVNSYPTVMSDTTTTTATISGQEKKNKSKSTFGLLGKSRSTKDKDRNKERTIKGSETQSPRQQSPGDHAQNGRVTPTESLGEQSHPQQAPRHRHEKSAEGKSLAESMGGSLQRQNSKDRKPIPVREANNMPPTKDQHSKSMSSMSSSGSHNTFLSNFTTFGTKAADKIHKTIFNKVGRSGSTNEKDHVVDDDHYVLKVLNRPLLEQTRKTRISKRLEDSRDKTEFWMPAFPWRAIDYLNYKGCEVEGLYRVPGSGPQIKMWQRKFDQEGDVDLFEQENLYDINIIGSMLKAWFRELPDELFPKSSQDRVARECAALNITTDDVEHVPVPQVLIDELSNLSPFNYYLLFAITCHLSLLLNHSEKNKMDYRNLCICFQPCMKLDALCFKFLVCDWRNCWKGCKTEAAYVEQEYQLFDMTPPAGTIQGEPPIQYDGRSSLAAESLDERNVSSSSSSKPSSVSVAAEGNRSKNNASGQAPKNSSTSSTTLTMTSPETAVTPRSSQDNGNMRPLSPIKPLSPMAL